MGFWGKKNSLKAERLGFLGLFFVFFYILKHCFLDLVCIITK